MKQMSMRWLHTLRWRLTLWYAATLAAGLALFAAASFAIVSNALNTRSDRFLRDARGGFLVELAVEASEYADDSTAIRMAAKEVRFEETTFLVYDSAGANIAASSDDYGDQPAARTSQTLPLARAHVAPLDTAKLRPILAEYTQSGSQADELKTLKVADGEFRILVGGTTVHGRKHTVLAVYDRAEHYEVMRRVSRAYAIAVPLLVIAAIAGGYLLAKRALSPVGAMARQARAISATTLHERLPVENSRDELGELSLVINELLGRLQQSFDQQTRFVADASHELRTPVAILQAETDVILARQGRTEAEYREALSVVNKSSQRLAHIVNDLFLLARADAGHMMLVREPLYLDELLSEAIRALRSVALRAGVEVCFTNMTDEQGSSFSGSPALLDRLILNLLDNAIKYSLRNGVVQVTLSRNESSYRIGVIDAGPGIPLEAQAKIFDRFFRVDKSRGRVNEDANRTASSDRTNLSGTSGGAMSSGAGLGLAIARWIAEAHGGSLQLSSSTPGRTEFRVDLPLAQEPLKSRGTQG